jgi:ribose transport system ATP-binding protein
VLVLDEPTQGVDVGAKATIHDLVVGAATGGAAVVVCSSDVEELVQVSTRVLVFRRGRLGAELTGPDLTVERIEEEQLLPTEARPANGAAGGAFQEGEISHA